MTNKSQSNTLTTELAELKEMTRSVMNSLQEQDKALREYGIKLPPGVLVSLSSIVKDIAAVQQSLASDDVELNQLRSLAATGAMINSTLNVNDVLSKAMNQVVALAGAERGFVILVNEHSGELEFRVSHDSTLKPGQSNTPQLSMTVVNEVLESGTALLTDNAYKDPRIQDNLSVAQFVLRSVICVPLTQRGETIGVIYVDNRLRAGVFTQRELNLLTAFANQAAVAIENARLFARIQSSISEITEIKDVMDSVFASVGSGIITTNASDLVITFNRAAEETLGVRADDVISKPLVRVLPRMEEADLEMQLQLVREENQDVAFQTTVMLPNHEEPSVLSLKLSPLRDDNEQTQGVTVVLDDLSEQNEREALLDVLQNYLPPGMMSRIHEIAGIDLGGERREVTCMFAETRPFNSFPEGTTPAELMTMINRYLSVATEAIHEQEGVIDKYMGSEVMVLFNSQLNPQADHTLRAIYTALHLRDMFIKFYDALGIQPDPHFYRVGIHSGIATLGNVGSLYRRNFTAIGDTINLSKRLEENATYGQIIISEDTLMKARAVVGSEHIEGVRFVERDPIQVKGRQQVTRIYEVFRE